MEGVGSDHWAKVLVDNAALARSGTGTGTGDGDLDWVSVAQSSMALADSLRTRECPDHLCYRTVLAGLEQELFLFTP